jgi:hypothetical protein
VAALSLAAVLSGGTLVLAILVWIVLPVAFIAYLLSDKYFPSDYNVVQRRRYGRRHPAGQIAPCCGHRWGDHVGKTRNRGPAEPWDISGTEGCRICAAEGIDHNELQKLYIAARTDKRSETEQSEEAQTRATTIAHYNRLKDSGLASSCETTPRTPEYHAHGPDGSVIGTFDTIEDAEIAGLTASGVKPADLPLVLHERRRLGTYGGMYDYWHPDVVRVRQERMRADIAAKEVKKRHLEQQGVLPRRQQQQPPPQPSQPRRIPNGYRCDQCGAWYMHGQSSCGTCNSQSFSPDYTWTTDRNNQGIV